MSQPSSSAALPPEAIALATRLYDAARAGQMDIFQQALPAGLPANMTNEKGDSLVSVLFFFRTFDYGRDFGLQLTDDYSSC